MKTVNSLDVLETNTDKMRGLTYKLKNNMPISKGDVLSAWEGVVCKSSLRYDFLESLNINTFTTLRSMSNTEAILRRLKDYKGYPLKDRLKEFKKSFDGCLIPLINKIMSASQYKASLKIDDKVVVFSDLSIGEIINNAEMINLSGKVDNEFISPVIAHIHEEDVMRAVFDIVRRLTHSNPNHEVAPFHNWTNILESPIDLFLKLLLEIHGLISTTIDDYDALESFTISFVCCSCNLNLMSGLLADSLYKLLDYIAYNVLNIEKN